MTAIISRGSGSVLPSLMGGRLTLATGYSVYTPLPATPSSTDTTAETTTFSAPHGWTTGTIVTPSATGGGLTTGTPYYLNAVSTTAVSYHTTLANAEAASSPVNLTASITAEIRPAGAASTTLRYTAYIPGKNDSTAAAPFWVWLWTGSTPSAGVWEAVLVPSELSLPLTVTSGSNYNVYLQKSGASAALVLGAAWTGNTTPSETLSAYAGGGTLSGLSTDMTKLHIGVLRASATDTVEDSGILGATIAHAQKRLLCNTHNRVLRSLRNVDGTSHTYDSATPRQWRAQSTNQVEWVSDVPPRMTILVRGTMTSSTGVSISAAAGLDSTTVTNVVALTSGTAVVTQRLSAAATIDASAGYHFLAFMQFSNATATNSYTSGDLMTDLLC